jgi:hypothetical protein
VSLEKRAAARAPVNAWRMSSTPPNQGAPVQAKEVLHYHQSAGSSSSIESHAESPSLPESSLNSNSPAKTVLSSGETGSPAVNLHKSATRDFTVTHMKSVIPPLPLVPASIAETASSLENPEPGSPSLKHAVPRRISKRPPPGLAPPPGFENSPLLKPKNDEAIGEPDILSNDLLLGHRRVGTLASDPWSTVAGVDLIQSLSLGPSSLLKQTGSTSQPHDSGPVNDDHLNVPLTASPEVISGNDIIGHITDAAKLSQSVSTMENTSLQVGVGELGGLGLNSHSSMGLFNVDKFLGFLDEDDYQGDSQNAEDYVPSYSSALFGFRKSENITIEEESVKDLWDPSSGEIISPTRARARSSVSTAIGGERSTSMGSTASPIPNAWIRNRDEARTISGLGSGLLTPDLLKDSSEDISDVPATKRNPFFAHWMSESS